MENEPKTETPPSTNPPGTPTTASLPGIDPATLQAGRAALDSGVGETPPKKRGRPIIHGKYAGGKRPHRSNAELAERERRRAEKLSLGQMDNGPASPLLEENNPHIVPVDFENQPTGFDREAEKPYAEMIVDALAEVKGELNGWRVYRKTGNRDFATMIADKTAAFPEQRRKILIESGLDCAEKYQVSLRKCPEAFFGGTLATCLLQDSKLVRDAIAEYFKNRPQEAPAPTA